MAILTPPDKNLWKGRLSSNKLYLHEKIELLNNSVNQEASIVLLGYACEEGVLRNQGRIGAIEGPNAIRKQLAKMPNHLDKSIGLADAGDVFCDDKNMEETQRLLSKKVHEILKGNAFPILLGGGHDIAYGHYTGIRKHVGHNASIGIINFDAHFDLRSNENGNNSGTPFFQIAEDCKNQGNAFKYICLGVRKDANDRELYRTARILDTKHLDYKDFTIENAKLIVRTVLDFIQEVDHIYVTIDLDGFSSAYAPGVSAPSPMGFSPKIVIETLELILKSKKLIAMDVAEMNPSYDIDNQTAKLAASLIHYVMHNH